MTEKMCNLFEICETPEAPLCPMQENTVKHGIWYADEPVCRSKQFQALPWIKKQKQIAQLRFTTDDGFFTVRMFNSVHVVTKNLKGANPDNVNAELRWLKERSEKRAAAPRKRRTTTVVKRKRSATLTLWKEPDEASYSDSTD